MVVMVAVSLETRGRERSMEVPTTTLLRLAESANDIWQDILNNEPSAAFIAEDLAIELARLSTSAARIDSLLEFTEP